MLEVQSKNFQRGRNVTSVYLIDEESYLNFEALLSGDWRSRSNNDVLEESIQFLYKRFEPAKYITELDGKVETVNSKIEELDKKSKAFDEIIEKGQSKVAELEALILKLTTPEDVELTGLEEIKDDHLELDLNKLADEETTSVLEDMDSLDLDNLDLGDLNLEGAEL